MNLLEMMIVDYFKLYFREEFLEDVVSIHQHFEMSEDEYATFVRSDVVPEITKQMLLDYYFPHRGIREVVLNDINQIDSLLDCPFCGRFMDFDDKIDVVYPNKSHTLHSVNCFCGASVIGYTRMDAIAHWNKREYCT